MPYRCPCLLVLVALLALGGTPGHAHEVTTTDGTVYEGKVLREDDKEVVIETTFDGTKTLARSDVKSVNTSTPPLREQLAYRASTATDVAGRWALYTWAKGKGFEKELGYILEAIVDLAPNDRKARKLMGHKKVDGRWMSPEEETRYHRERFEAAQRAEGLVPYKGGWVTPEERDAREKGLKKDGDDWVTQEEWHRRRGKQLVEGMWIKVGFKEGKELSDRAVRGSRVKLAYHWGPHFDVLAEVKPELATRIVASAEKAFSVMRRVLAPGPADYPETVDERVKLILLLKLPSFVRFAKWFDKTFDVDSLVPGWARAIQRQHSWWWIQDIRATCVYQFPNTDKTFVSNVLHNAGLILITRYKANYTEPSVWLREGFAYYLELESIGYTQSFTLGRGGGSGGAAAGAKGPLWMDSEQWRPALTKLVSDGQDPPLRRVAKMTLDQFRYVELVKSWSVIEFLIRWDSAKFKTFVDLSKDRAKAEQDALREAYGVGYRGLDEKWRAYVGAGFTLP